jgi:hypothetical protein
MEIRTLGFVLACAAMFGMTGCNNTPKQDSEAPGLAEAVSTANDAYIYGYPLVTMDMTRKRFTNVASPDATHAPMGQLLKLRTYPAVDDHAPPRAAVMPRALSSSAIRCGEEKPAARMSAMTGSRSSLRLALAAWRTVTLAAFPFRAMRPMRSLSERTGRE